METAKGEEKEEGVRRWMFLFSPEFFYFGSSKEMRIGQRVGANETFFDIRERVSNEVAMPAGRID